MQRAAIGDADRRRVVLAAANVRRIGGERELPRRLVGGAARRPLPSSAPDAHVASGAASAPRIDRGGLHPPSALIATIERRPEPGHRSGRPASCRSRHSGRAPSPPRNSIASATPRDTFLASATSCDQDEGQDDRKGRDDDDHEDLQRGHQASRQPRRGGPARTAGRRCAPEWPRSPPATPGPPPPATRTARPRRDRLLRRGASRTERTRVINRPRSVIVRTRYMTASTSPQARLQPRAVDEHGLDLLLAGLGHRHGADEGERHEQAEQHLRDRSTGLSASASRTPAPATAASGTSDAERPSLGEVVMAVVPVHFVPVLLPGKDLIPIQSQARLKWHSLLGQRVRNE